MQYPTNDETWSIVSRHLSSKGASDQSIQSFDNFVHRAFPQAIYRLFQVDTQLGLDLSKRFQTQITNVVCLKPLLLIFRTAQTACRTPRRDLTGCCHHHRRRRRPTAAVAARHQT